MDMEDTGHTASNDKEADAAARAADQHPAENGTNEADLGMEALLRDAEYTFRRVRRGETIEGTVVRVDPDEILVDIGLKSEGVIPARELWSEDEEFGELQPGDRTLVYVLQPEGQEGHAVLSLKRARMERSWREVEELFNRGDIIEAPVVDFNKGGLIVDVKGIRGFVPVSQVLDLRNVARGEGENEETAQTLAAMKGRRLQLKVIEINRSRNRLILSELSAVQERRTQRKDELLEGLQPGQIRKGVVSNLTNFGAFVDLGGADGLVHVSEMSYNRVNHPSEVLQVGQEIDVYVLSVDRETKKIALSLKRALPDPWDTVEERYHLGQVVPVTITKLQRFGAFAKVEQGLEGLIHLSELTDLPVHDPSQVVREGQEVNAKIISLNSQKRRLGLSVRQAIQPLSYFDGEIHENTPFADHDFTDFDFGEPEGSTYDTATDEETSSPEGMLNSDALAEPGIENEPSDGPATVNGSAAGTNEEAPVASADSSTATEDDEHPVGSAASPGTPE
jgi:small subunit ribosomal protein S1